MPRTSVDPVPRPIRVAILRRELRAAAGQRAPRRAARAVRSLLAPRRWPPPAAVRLAALDAAVRAGDIGAARFVVAHPESDPDSGRPGLPAAILRAHALEVVAATLPDAERVVEHAVAEYLLGDAVSSPPPDAAPPLERANAAVAHLRAAGHPRPAVVATYPGWKSNPYGTLMEQAYEAGGLAPVHVDDPDGVDQIVAGAVATGYRVVVHCNAPDRFVRAVQAEALAESEDVVRRIDGWLGAGAILVTSIHNMPRLTGERGAAERRIAQAIVDRSALVHILAADTVALLDGWIRIDPAKIVHVAHPNYDGVYADIPDQAASRRRIGIAETNERRLVVAGLVGTLSRHKGGQLLLDALDLVPDPLPDGRHLQVVIAGRLIGPGREPFIRRALGDPRVTARLGFLADEELPALLGALDVAIVPYERMLNSGWLHLALTAGLPVIAPVEGTAPGIVHPHAIRTFAAGDPGSLAAALTRAGELANDGARGAARATVVDLDAASLSLAFVQAVRAAMDRNRA